MGAHPDFWFLLDRDVDECFDFFFVRLPGFWVAKFGWSSYRVVVFDCFLVVFFDEGFGFCFVHP